MDPYVTEEMARERDMWEFEQLCKSDPQFQQEIKRVIAETERNQHAP